MRAPDFWRRRGAPSALLAPLGAAYGAAAIVRRRLARPWRAAVPVVCVGNITVGGAGKTPLAIALCRHLEAAGMTPHLISRGYGGRTIGPCRIDPDRHGADAVGDEPLLLAAVAPTWVARDRAAAARAAEDAGAGCLVLDDGLQNFGLAKDLSVIAIDGGYGFGNRRVVPAGPLREPLGAGLARTNAAVVIGTDQAGGGSLAAASMPVYAADMAPLAGPARDGIAGRDVLAFAGIGRPAKFHDTLRGLGCRLVATEDFPDHHPYGADEVARIVERAAAAGALAVTTAKDAVRLPRDARAMVRILEVELEWRDRDAPGRLLATVLRDG